MKLYFPMKHPPPIASMGLATIYYNIYSKPIFVNKIKKYILE